MSDEQPETAKRERKHAAIYFDPRNSKAFKELAARVRSEGGRTTLVWSDRWKGAESLLMEARAVVIQKGCALADDICEAYRKYAHDVEIHFVNAAGEFEDEGATQDEGNDTEDGGDAQDKSAGLAGENPEADTTVSKTADTTEVGTADDPSGADADSDGRVPGISVEKGPEESSDPVGDAGDGLED